MEGFKWKKAIFFMRAASIAGFFYGDPTRTRQNYHLAETGELPIIKIGRRLTARRSALIRAIEEREREVVDVLGRENRSAHLAPAGRFEH